MQDVKEKLGEITAQVEAMTRDERDNCRLRELITVTDGNTGEALPARWSEVRIFWKDGVGLCYYRKGSRRRGYRYELRSAVLELALKVKHPVDAAKQWERSIAQVIARLTASKLWPELLVEAKIAQAVGYATLQKAYAASDDYRHDDSETWEQGEARRNEQVKAIDARLMNEKGFANTTILWHFSHPIVIKAMRFDKWEEENASKLAELARAMKAKKGVHLSGRTSYDISLEYAPEKGMKAWYSEEFKDCGNGHYYLALDATHAMFYEND